MNLQLNREEFLSLWKMLHKEKKEVKKQSFGNRLKKDTLRAKEPQISYFDLIMGFVHSGTYKINKTTDKADILINKFRTQMKKLNLGVDKLYKAYDPKDMRFVMRNDFIETSRLLGFEFDEEELTKIFEVFCQAGKESSQATVTRFNAK